MTDKELRELAVLFVQKGYITMDDIMYSDYLSNATDKEKERCMSYITEIIEAEKRVKLYEKRAEREAEKERIRKEKKDNLHDKRIIELSPFWNFLTVSSKDYFGDMTQERFKEILKQGKNGKKQAEKERKRLEDEQRLKDIEFKKRIDEAKEKLKEVEKATNVEKEEIKDLTDFTAFKHLISDITQLKDKYSFKEARSKKLMSNVSGLLTKVISYVEKHNQ